MHKLIEKAKACNRQEILQSYNDPSYNRWRIANRMPLPAYWLDVKHYPSKDLEVEEDSQGRITITRITRKGVYLGHLGTRGIHAREEMYDKRRFSQITKGQVNE